MTLVEIDTRLGKDSNILDVEVKNYSECGYCSDPKNMINLEVPWKIYSEWLYLSHQIGDKEWAGVFTVKDEAVTDFKIPKQEISSVSVEFKEELGGNGIVHSHHGMGAFHSTQDDKHCRNLFEYSIVVSSHGYTASKRVEVPCGAFAYLSVSLTVAGIPPSIDLSKITERESRLDINGKNQDQETYLVPDQPAISIEDSPCDKCTTYDCDNCQLELNAHETWATRF